jgi:hypothetical protein
VGKIVRGNKAQEKAQGIEALMAFMDSTQRMQ